MSETNEEYNKAEDLKLLKKKANKNTENNGHIQRFFLTLKKQLLEVLQLDIHVQIPFWVPFIWYFFSSVLLLVQIILPLLFILFYFSPRIITKFLKRYPKIFKKQEFFGTFDESYFSWRGIQVRGTDVFYKDRKMIVTVSEIRGLLPWPSLFTLLTQLPQWKSEKKVAKGLYIRNAYGKDVKAEYFLKRSEKIPPFPIFLQLFSMEHMCVGRGEIDDLLVKLNRDADKKDPIFMEAKHIDAVNKPDEDIPHVVVTGKELEVRTHTDTIKFDYARGDLTWETIQGQFRRKPLNVRSLVMRGVTGNMDGQERDKNRQQRENDMENWNIDGVRATEVDLMLKPFWKRPDAEIRLIIEKAYTTKSFILKELPNALVYHSETTGSLDGKDFKIEQMTYCLSPSAEVSPRSDCEESAFVTSEYESDSEYSIELKNARVFDLPPLPSSFWSDKLSLPLFNMFPNAEFGFRVISTDEGSRYRWRVKGTIIREQGTKNIELKRVFIEKQVIKNALVFGAETAELVGVLTDVQRI